MISTDNGLKKWIWQTKMHSFTSLCQSAIYKRSRHWEIDKFKTIVQAHHAMHPPDIFEGDILDGVKYNSSTTNVLNNEWEPNMSIEIIT